MKQEISKVRICPRCRIREKITNNSYCKECWDIYRKEYEQRPEIKKKRKEYRQLPKYKNIKREYEQKPEVKKKRRVYNKKYEQKPEVKKKRREYEQQPEVKKRKKKYNLRPEVKQKRKEYRKQHRKQPEVKQKRKEYAKKYKKEHKEELKKYKKKYYQKPEVKKKAKKYSKEYYQRIIKEENKKRKDLGLPLVGEGYKSEMELLVYIRSLFQDFEIFTHHRKPLMDWKPIGLELDIYIPKLKLAFEYMGGQHYKRVKYYHKTKEDFEYQQYRDRCKKKLCRLKGIKLIRIKYDEKLSEQLILSKLKHFPDLGMVLENLKNYS